MAVGGSGHEFMQIPTPGESVVDLLERMLDEKLKSAFR
jgi:hypothetical protein